MKSTLIRRLSVLTVAVSASIGFITAPTYANPAVDPYQSHVSSAGCSHSYYEKPGVVEFKNMILSRIGGTNGGIVACTGYEHEEGRAWDWMNSAADPAAVARVDQVLNWMFATDSQGNPHAMARRLGIAYVQWNGQIINMASSNKEWRSFSCSGWNSCHSDHVHIAFSWAGAQQQTSWFTTNPKPGNWYPDGTLIPPTEAGKVDVNGDGKADLVAQNGDSIWVKLSTGTSFGAGSQWGTGAFSGSVANLAGDVNGDGKADLIAQNGDNVWVRTSTGYSFNAPAHWGTVPFSGDLANLLGDVNGDGRDDLIAMNGDSIWVRTSTGSTFNSPQQWGTGAFSGNKTNHVADVNGDGRADMVAQNADSVWVRTSNGSGFNAPSQWALNPFFGTVANLMDDLNGDGRDDLIAMNGDSIWVRISNGSGFNAASNWAAEPFFGTVANHVGDVDGNGRADLIAQNGDSIWVRESVSVGLTSAAQWAVGAFSGDLANHG